MTRRRDNSSQCASSSPPTPMRSRISARRHSGSRLRISAALAGHPCRHGVGVGVVVDAGLLRPRVAVVILVRPHDAADVVATRSFVEGRETRHETCQLEEQLRPPGAEGLLVPRPLVVLPDVVGDGHRDVPLQVGVVRQPAPGARVEMHRLRLFASVAAALPREHRPALPRRAGRGTRLWQAAVSVEQQGPRDLRQTARHERHDVELVPEDVPAIGLAMEAPSGHAHVKVDDVRRSDLDRVEGVQPQHEARLAILRQSDGAAAPETLPGPLVKGEQLREGLDVGQVGARGRLRSRDRRVSRRMQCHDLLDRDRTAGLGLHGEAHPDVARAHDALEHGGLRQRDSRPR